MLHGTSVAVSGAHTALTPVHANVCRSLDKHLCPYLAAEASCVTAACSAEQWHLLALCLADHFIAPAAQANGFWRRGVRLQVLVRKPERQRPPLSPFAHHVRHFPFPSEKRSE